MVILRCLASVAPYLSLTRLLTVSWMSSRTPSSCLDDLRSSLDWAVDSRNWRRAESRSSSRRLELDIAELGLESGLRGLEDSEDTDLGSGDIRVLDSGDIVLEDMEDIMVLDSGEIVLLDSGL